jgi:hypothetical protein
MASSAPHVAVVDTPVLAWRARDVFAVEDEDEDEGPTIRIPEFASLLAQSIAEDSGEVEALREEIVHEDAPIIASTMTPPRREPESWLRHVTRVRAAAALALAAALFAIVGAIASASRVKAESTAIARSIVCPAPPQVVLTRAASASPVLTVKQSVRRVTHVHPRVIAVRTPPRPTPPPPPRVPPRPGIIRRAPF